MANHKSENPIIVNGHVPSVVKHIDLTQRFDDVIAQLDAARDLILTTIWLKHEYDGVSKVRILIQTVESENDNGN